MAVAAQGVDRAYQVVPVVRDETAKCMLGHAGPGFMEMVGLVVRSLEEQLKQGIPLSMWTPPMSGVHSGETRTGRVVDLTMMLRTMARNSAFLSRMADFTADDEQETPVSDRWLTQVKEAMAVNHPDLVCNFSRKLQLYNGGSRPRLIMLAAITLLSCHEFYPAIHFPLTTGLRKPRCGS